MKGSPKTQTSSALSTTAPPICRWNECTMLQALPFQWYTRDCVTVPWVNAHASLGERAAAAMTGPVTPRVGNGTCFQLDPLRSHAVGVLIPLNAHPPLLPSAATAVKSPVAPLCTWSVIRQAAPPPAAVAALLTAIPYAPTATAVIATLAPAQALLHHMSPPAEFVPSPVGVRPGSSGYKNLGHASLTLPAPKFRFDPGRWGRGGWVIRGT